MGGRRQLKQSSPEWLKALRDWSPAFLEMPVHSEIRHAMRLGIAGVESGVVIGSRGVGKTYAIRTLAQIIQDEEIDRSLRDPQYAPRRIVVYEASESRGSKTALIDCFEVLAGPMSTSMRRSRSPRRLIEEIAGEIQAQGIHLICIDEAQMIDASNLDQLRQVIDHCAKDGHPFAYLLAGSEELRDTLVQIQQLGQRFATQISFPPISLNEIAPLLPEFHPHLADLKAQLGSNEWRALERDLFRAVSGKFRRLQTILANANALAIEWHRPIDAEILGFAIGKLAPEV